MLLENFMEKFYARIKHLCEDFIVEEIGPTWDCKILTKNKIIVPKKPAGKNYLWFEMTKRDIDHLVAIKTIAKQIKKDLRFIGYAGAKDKKAVTCQMVSVFEPDVNLVKNFNSRFIWLKNFRWEKRKIKLGYLIGNRFRITLRDLSKKDVQKAKNLLVKTKSFLNFFGGQRFGSVRKNNAEIGKLILKRKFKEAVLKILTEDSENEKEDIRLARKKLKKEKNFKDALGYFPENLKLEIKILESLSKKEDYLQALKTVEKRYALLLIQSVQSKIFNKVVRIANEKRLFNQKLNKSALIGYKVSFSPGKLGEIEKKALEEEGLKKEDFNLKEIPYLRLKGSYRQAVVEVKNLKIEVKEDEIFKPSKKVLLEFILPKGTYATTYLENFFAFQ